MDKFLASILVFILLVQSGCASIVSGRNQGVSINSNPSEAAVVIDGQQRGKTPLKIELERKKRHQIILNKEGYVEEMRVTKRGFNWWYIGNALIPFAGIVGMFIDFMTGAVYKVKPKDINVTLEKAK